MISVFESKTSQYCFSKCFCHIWRLSWYFCLSLVLKYVFIKKFIVSVIYIYVYICVYIYIFTEFHFKNSNNHFMTIRHTRRRLVRLRMIS